MQQLTKGTLLHGSTYKIEQVLGQGSFGITYLATHTALGKKVAIKEFFMKELNGRAEDGSITGMSDGSLSMDYAHKFQKEALNLSRLEHPNIVRVTDSFEDNGTFYYVMDYVEGENLNDYIKHHHVSQQEAVDIIRDVAKALMYMHEEKHMLHLDLKPGNIMRRTSDGHIFLIDFGLSKHYSNDGQPETSTTIGLGTAGYAPIEQANQAKNGEFRPTIDVYALGATFYKLLTGETPPAASELVSDDEVLADKLQENNVEERLATVIIESMLPNVKRRTKSVRDFLSLLACEKEEFGVTDSTVSSLDDEATTIEASKSNLGSQNNYNSEDEDKQEENYGIFSFNGRIGRLEYLLNLVVFTTAWISIVAICSLVLKESAYIFIAICGSVAFYWVTYAQGAKRCHDIGRSGWWQLIPFYGFAMLFCSGEDDNGYGKAHGVGAIKNGKILGVVFIVSLFVIGMLIPMLEKNTSGEISSPPDYEYADTVAVDTVI